MIRTHPGYEFYPMFQRYFDAGLAQASYLLACDRTRQAIVIDPRRDADVYLAAAAQLQLTIVAAIETHIHADFLSGARELAVKGSRILAGPGSSLKFPSREVQDDETLGVGSLALRFLHTPGHTPEHISILVQQPDAPDRLFTGDTLFVGAVGRPDLLGDAQMRRLAGELHDSLFHKILMLDDRVEVHPGHGAGSLCGAGIGSDPHSTVGRERHANRMLGYDDRDEFVRAVLSDLPETPPYFKRMKRLNQDGPPLVGFADGYPGVNPIKAGDAFTAVSNGALAIDLRDAASFASGHPSTALSITFGPKVGYWAGWVVPDDTPVVLLARSAQEAAEAGRQLMRVGVDRIKGYIDGGFDAWRAAGLPESALPQISIGQLRERLARPGDLTVVDVRSAHEWETGHIDTALHVPIGEAASRALDLVGRGVLATICEGGHRSMLGASILARAGLTNVVNVSGGMAAYRSLRD